MVDNETKKKFKEKFFIDCFDEKVKELIIKFYF